VGRRCRQRLWCLAGTVARTLRALRGRGPSYFDPTSARTFPWIRQRGRAGALLVGEASRSPLIRHGSPWSARVPPMERHRVLTLCSVRHRRRGRRGVPGGPDAVQGVDVVPPSGTREIRPHHRAARRHHQTRVRPRGGGAVGAMAASGATQRPRPSVSGDPPGTDRAEQPVQRHPQARPAGLVPAGWRGRWRTEREARCAARRPRRSTRTRRAAASAPHGPAKPSHWNQGMGRPDSPSDPPGAGSGSRIRILHIQVRRVQSREAACD
jgi:hypothetical protein